MIPNPQGFSSSFLPAWNLKELRGVFWISPCSTPRSGWEHQEELLSHERAEQWVNSSASSQQPGTDRAEWGDAGGSLESIWREIPFMNDSGVHFHRDHPCLVNKGLENSTLEPIHWGETLMTLGWAKGEEKQVREPELLSLAAASQNVLTKLRNPTGACTNLSCLLCIFKAEGWAPVQTHNLCEGMSQQIGKG